MRVIVANKFWYPRGGLERVMFEEIDQLSARGVDFAHFSTTHPENQETPWSSYFVDYLELGREGGLGASEKVLAAARMFHNGIAARRFTALIDAFEPDLVHAHGIHRQLSPSILAAARTRGVPVVESLHDFHHVCPADLLLAGDGEPCQPVRCSGLRYGPAVTLRCVRGSWSASALSAAETWWQRARRVYERSVTRFVSPSRFLADVMRADGWRQPIDVIPNPVEADETGGGAAGGDAYVLIAGRLSPEKGLEDALKAAALAKVPVVVAGDGPLRDTLRTRYTDVRFVGRVSGEEVRRLMESARATIVPSRCVENAPLTVLESMAAGTLVIATRVGGVPELIDDTVDGILVEPGDVDSLAAALRIAAAGGPAVEGMVAAAASRVRTRNATSVHADLLLQTYEESVSA